MVARSPSLVVAVVVLVSLALGVVQCAGETIHVDAVGCVTTWYPSQFDYYGGSGGGAFNDNTNPYPCGQYYPSSIQFSSGYLLDSFQAFYLPSNQSPGKHGGGGGGATTLNLATGEYINKITIYANRVIDSVFIGTTGGQQLTLGTNPNGSPIVYTSNFQANEYLAYFDGKCGDVIDALRIVTFRVTA